MCSVVVDRFIGITVTPLGFLDVTQKPILYQVNLDFLYFSWPQMKKIVLMGQSDFMEEDVHENFLEKLSIYKLVEPWFNDRKNDKKKN